MKNFLTLLTLIMLLYLPNTFAQNLGNSHIGKVPNYDSQEVPFKIFGVLYMSDGVTPAKNYSLTINQANEKGDFIVDENNNLISAASIKTNEDGYYEFYTYIPGNDRRYNRLQEIYMKVETPNGDAYAMPTLLFETDPMLTKRCRKQIAKRCDSSRILKLEKAEGLINIERNMTLSLDLERI